MLFLIKQKAEHIIAHNIILNLLKNMEDNVRAIFFMADAASIFFDEHEKLLSTYIDIAKNKNIEIYVCGKALTKFNLDPKTIPSKVVVAGYTNLVIESYKADKVIEF